MVRLPLISIGLPVRNGATRLAGAIQALLQQEFEDFELIISDNASTDDTHAICLAAAKEDARIKYHHVPEDIGATKNFERVLAAASGEFFMWAGHDDRWEPRYLASLLKALRNDPTAVLATSDIRQVHPNGAETIHAFADDISNLNPAKRLRWIWRCGGWGAIYGLHRRAILTRTRALSQMAGVPSPGLSPDYKLVELAIIGRFARVPEPLFICNLRPPEISLNRAYLSAKLAPAARYNACDTLFWWALKDSVALAISHPLPFHSRFSIPLELLRSARARGALHDVLSVWNAEAFKAALEKRDYLRLLTIYLERVVLTAK